MINFTTGQSKVRKSKLCSDLSLISTAAAAGKVLRRLSCRATWPISLHPILTAD